MADTGERIAMSVSVRLRVYLRNYISDLRQYFEWNVHKAGVFSKVTADTQANILALQLQFSSKHVRHALTLLKFYSIN